MGLVGAVGKVTERAVVTSQMVHMCRCTCPVDTCTCTIPYDRKRHSGSEPLEPPLRPRL